MSRLGASKRGWYHSQGPTTGDSLKPTRMAAAGACSGHFASFKRAENYPHAEISYIHCQLLKSVLCSPVLQIHHRAVAVFCPHNYLAGLASCLDLGPAGNKANHGVADKAVCSILC